MEIGLARNRKIGSENRGVVTTIFLVFFAFFLLAVLPAWAGDLSEALKSNDIIHSKLSNVKHLIKGVHIKESSDDQGKKYKEDEILVKFKAEASEHNKTGLHKKHGSEKIREFSTLHIHHVKLKKGVSVKDAIKLYQEDPDVEYAEPNYRVTVQATPNDPLFGQLWGLNNTGLDADIDAPEAWDITKGSSNVVVAVIDTGVDYNHQDLAVNIWKNTGEIPGNGIDDDGNGYVDDVYGIDAVNYDRDPFDDHGHGTHVSGTIGAVGNNNIGVAGVNWNIKIMPCKFLDSGGYGYMDGAVQCLNYIKKMKDRGVNVVATSNSWGCDGSGCYSQALYDAIHAQQDILFIAAAGNSSMNLDQADSFPAKYDLPNVIAVAAIDSGDALAYFSSFGKQWVHVGAPGVSILSTLPAANIWNISGGYGYLSGTSMATPHVSGLAGLLKAQDQSRDSRVIKNLILYGSEPTNALRDITVMGGRINANNSVRCDASSAIPRLKVLKYPETLSVGTPVTLSALSIRCGSASGPVTVTLSGGEVIDLHDDGVAPDLAAGDGIFSATWTPIRYPEKLIFSTPGAAPVAISVPSLYIAHYLPEANRGVPYHQHLTAVGAKEPYSWSLLSGSLPPGLTLDSSTGEISGTATSTGTFSFTVQVSDGWGISMTRTVPLRVSDGAIREEFARTLHGDTGANGRDIVLDASGNIHILGTLSGDNYIAKYDASGTLLWLKPYETGYLRAIALDGEGNIYAAGGTAEWDTGDTLVVKFDPSGNKVWEKKYNNGQRTDVAMDITLDKNGNIYLGGIAESGFAYSMYAQKIDSSGNSLWIKTYSQGMADYGYAIGVDNAGNVILGGSSAIGVPDQGGTAYWYDTVIRKYDPSGNLIWHHTYDTGSRYDFLSDLKVDGNGNIYALDDPEEGSYTAFVTMKYSPAGDLLWARKYQSISHWPAALAVDQQGNVYATGASWQEAGTSDWDFLTLKYDPSGNLLWKKVSDSGYYLSQYDGDFAYGIAVDSGGNALVVGASNNGLGSYDMLMIKYSELFDIVTGMLPAGVLNTAYSQTLIASGGAAPYTWSIASGSLPPGMALNAAGQISGVPTVTGTYTFTVQVMDSSTAVRTKTFTLTITSAALSITTPSLTTGLTGIAYQETLTAAGGTPPYTWSISSGSLPPGLYLTNTNGAILGTPTTTGTFSFTAKVTDANSTIATRDFSIVIYEPLSIITPSLPDGAIGAPYNQTLTAAGGTPPYTWSLTFGALPAGITLNAATGVISGIAGSAGTFNFTLQVMDINNSSYAKGFSLFIAGGTVPGNGVSAWGLNMYGQLGDGTTNSRENPAPVLGISGVTALAAPMDSSLALRSDGTVWQWGSNNDAGPRGPNTYSTLPVQVPGLFGITSITAGWFHSLVLRSDGTVWAWGSNVYGQLGDGTYEYRAVPVQVFGLYGVTAVAGGDAHSLALRVDGTVWAWGGNYNGQLGDGTNNWTTFPVQVVGLSDVIAIAAGVDHSLALKADGTVWAWGGNGNGQLGDGTNINRNYPAQVPILNGVRAIAGGGWHSVALDNNGIVWTWGRNDSGQLGDGLAADRYFAMPVSGLPPVTAIGAKCFRTVAVSYDGFLWTWGMAYTRSSIVPMPMPGISGVSSAAAGMDHTLVLQMTAPPVPHFIITATAGPSGSISPSGLMSVPSGSTQTFTVTPNAGYYPVMSGTCGGTLSGTGSNYTYTTNPVVADCSVQADFALSSVLVTPSAGIAGTENVYQYETQWASQGGGLAVDASGNIYVSYTAGYIIQKFNSSGTLLMQWSAPSGGGGSGYIHDGLAVDASGNVYTALSYDNNIYKFDSNGTHLTHWGSVGTGNGQFNTPTGVAVDAAGNVYVVDSGNDRVQKFDSNGTYLTQWGSSGTGNGQFNEPIGVAVDGSGNVYVSDLFASRIQKFDSNGMYLAQWSTIWGPDGITTDSFGNIYVAGALSDRMQKLDSNGTYVTEWGSSGTGNGQFTYIQGVDVDMSRNIYVADGFNRVQKFRSVYSGTSSAGGSISPDTPQTVNPNGTISFSITPTAGYRIESVTGCGGTLAGNVYTIAPVTSDCTVKASFVMIPETSRPDLLVSSLTVPTTAGAGATVTVTDTTKNNGPGTAAVSVTRFYLSTDTTLDAADTQLGGRAIPELSAGATSSGTTTVTIPPGTATGTYYVIGKADGDEVIAEVNESNNTKSSGLIKIGPDLSVSALTVPGTAGAGASISVTDTTKNSGAGEAGASTTSFYLSADATLDAGDALIGSRSVGPIAGASSSQGAATVTIPGGIASGTYYIIARADAGSAVLELNEDNNTLYRSINIGPDLTMSAVTVPTAAGAGTTLTINDTTKNNGPGTAAASVTRFYLSTDTSLDSADTQLGSRAIPELSAGATSSGTTPVTIPTGTATGTYYVIAKADGDDLVAEVNELNNTKSSGSIKIGPDLIISALTVPSTAGAGVSITITDTTKNGGAGEAGASTTSFYLSADATLDAGDALIGSRSVGAIAAASSSQGTTSVTIPSTTASGTYYIIARADAGSAVSELNEDNNTLYRSINIGPDLTISTVTVPSAAGAGKGISITDTTKNNGPGTAAASTTRFYLSTDTSLDGNDTLLGNRALPTLAAGATNTGTTTVIIPTGTPTGAYYVIAKADGDEMIAEINESNNAKSSGLIKIGPDLVVLAVAVPSTAGAGKSISITDTTKNSGAGDADPTTTSFYLSTDSTLDSNDVLLGSRAVGSLAAGATNQGTTSVTIPGNTVSGAYYIISKADTGNTAPEINEDNNTYFKIVTIGPDLAVSTMTVPSTAGAGKNISITDTTKNNGPGDVGASTTSFYLSADTTVDVNDALLGSRSVAALTAGTNSAGSTSVTIPAGIASGMYYIIAQADSGTVVKEINENNNTFSRSINIGLDLVVSAVTAPSTAGAGTSISIADTTKNNGPGDIGTSATGIYLSTDSMLDGSDLLLGSRAVPDLVAGATNAGTTAVTIPAGTTAGTYYIIIKADKDDAIAELNEYNNTLLKTVIVK